MSSMARSLLTCGRCVEGLFFFTLRKTNSQVYELLSVLRVAVRVVQQHRHRARVRESGGVPPWPSAGSKGAP